MSLLILHIQATPTFHLESILQLEAMAYTLILRAKLKYNLLAPCHAKRGTSKLSFKFKYSVNIVVN